MIRQCGITTLIYQHREKRWALVSSTRSAPDLLSVLADTQSSPESNDGHSTLLQSRMMGNQPPPDNKVRYPTCSKAEE